MFVKLPYDLYDAEMWLFWYNFYKKRNFYGMKYQDHF